MDRTLDCFHEFRSFLRLSETKDEHADQDKFYESLYKSISEVSEQVANVGSYKSLLVLEGKVEDIRKKINLQLDTIKIEGPRDVQAHFEGIKYIINGSIIDAAKLISSAKNKMAGGKVNLAPE